MRNLGSIRKKCNKKRNRVFVVVSCIMPCGGAVLFPRSLSEDCLNEFVVTLLAVTGW